MPRNLAQEATNAKTRALDDFSGGGGKNKTQSTSIYVYERASVGWYPPARFGFMMIETLIRFTSMK
ncbi:hypothetical protein GOM46_06795 [Streptococcus infantis]|uniref:hypothetical protein n=1 Tax=Streptococcus infantis TaxID=68892 RepID=UPI001F3967D3|nr:hypothetical protein [Streptococcus infantis]UJD04288.1 hypothetical protein GOM46_06795 [Streptococcus infantis]